MMMLPIAVSYCCLHTVPSMKPLFYGTLYSMVPTLGCKVPSNNKLFDGTVPSMKQLFDGTVPSRKQLFDGTVPSNSFSLKGDESKIFLLAKDNLNVMKCILYDKSLQVVARWSGDREFRS